NRASTSSPKSIVEEEFESSDKLFKPSILSIPSKFSSINSSNSTRSGSILIMSDKSLSLGLTALGKETGFSGAGGRKVSIITGEGKIGSYLNALVSKALYSKLAKRRLLPVVIPANK